MNEFHSTNEIEKLSKIVSFEEVCMLKERASHLRYFCIVTYVSSAGVCI
jgi:hypothetical protein